MNIKLLLALASLLVCTTTDAGAITLSGFLNDPANAALRASDLSAPLFGDDFEIANNVALYAVTITQAGPVQFLSTGFAAGGVDPYFSLFLGSGNGAAVLGSNFAQAFSTGGDFDLLFLLAPATYTVAMGAFANLSFAENLGGGTLGDGFTGLGVPALLGTTYYELQITENAAVPEPSYVDVIGLLLLASAAASVAKTARLRALLSRRST